jgi:hypothetical protein
MRREPGPAGLSRADREPTSFAQQRRMGQQSATYQTINQAFNSLLPYFGPQTEMPLIYSMRPKGRRLGGFWPKRQVIGLNESYFDALGGNDPYSKKVALHILAHELAHYRQLDSKFKSRMAKEGAADAFAMLTAPQVLQATGMGDFPASRANFRAYGGALAQRFAKKYGREFVLRGQFGR